MNRKTSYKAYIAVLLGLSTFWACQKEETAKPVPLANFTFSRVDSTTLQLSFKNTSQNSISYLWDFGDGAAASIENPQHTYLEGGVYTVRLTATGEGGRANTAKTVEIPFLPKADFIFEGGNCFAPCEVKFQNRSKNTKTYDWDFGDGGKSQIKEPKYIYKKGGTYTVRLSTTGNGGVDRMTKTITIQDSLRMPVAVFEIQGSPCKAPCGIKFRNLSRNGERYRWEFGDGNSSSAYDPEYLYPRAGLYTVRLSVTNAEGYVDIAEKTVRVE